MADSLESLIIAVRDRKVLWDKRHKNYRNCFLVNRGWNDVAEIIGCTSEEAKKKWKNLCDSISRELRKIPKRRSGADADQNDEYNGDWPYFEAMQFLRQILKPRKTESNIINDVLLEDGDILDDDTIMSVLSDTTHASVNSQSQNNQLHDKQPLYVDITAQSPEDDETSVQSIQGTTPVASTFTSQRIGSKTNKSSRRNKENVDISAIIANLEKEKIELLRQNLQNENDEDLNWFKSIMPHLKKLPPMNKLLFRTNVQEMLLSELSKLNTISETLNNSSCFSNN